MALSSMTGFARSAGTSGAYAWAWELKSVNGKGLDIRLRLPIGWDAVDAPVRARAAARGRRARRRARRPAQGDRCARGARRVDAGTQARGDPAEACRAGEGVAR